VNGAPTIKRERRDLNHPIQRYLQNVLAQRRVWDRLHPEFAGWGAVEIDAIRTVLERGQPFIGIARPKGFGHQRRIKCCYSNAGDVALSERATYVEGYARSRPHAWTFPHAWLTLDGKHAFDQTLRDAEEFDYFGVVFTTKQIAEAVIRRRYWGPLLPTKSHLKKEPWS
jgi:hypothetical protein